MKSINRVQILGHVGKIISIQEHAHHKKIIKLSVITNERYKIKNGELKTESNSHFLVAKGSIAENIEKLVKVGSELLVEGKLTYRKKDGTNTYVAQIEVHDMIVLNHKD